jgi:hypothetical protein
MVDTYTIGEDGAWCWFQDPRAVRHVGTHDRTYTGWVTRDGDIVTARYDHDDGSVRTTTLHAGFERDDHDAPSFYVDSEGRLLAFYTRHGGAAIRYRRGERPEAIASFGPERSIAPADAHTYPDPRALDDTLYLFYRNGAGSVAYVRSGDDGRTWSDEHELVTTGGRQWCVYRKISDVHDGALELGLTFAEGGAHHPHRDVRHVRFDGETLATAGGADLGSTATFRDAPVVFETDATGRDAWIWDCSVAGGTPQLVYATFDGPDDHVYRYARWTGQEWRDARVADAGSYIVHGNAERYYSAGIALDHDEPGVCYYARGDHDGSALRQARTTDGGETWTVRRVTDGTVQNVRPVVPRGRHDDLRVLWMSGSYTFYADGGYETAIVGADVAPDASG